MRRRLSLPLTSNLELRPPSPDQMRERLGGRLSASSPRAGKLVSLLSSGGLPQVGVLLSDAEDGCDVLFERGLVKRTASDAISPHEGEASEELVALASQARVFAGLGEGSQVLVEQEGERTVGVLVEKCRWGALVELEDRKLLGVGFRRLWPAPSGEAN
jgi:hypothetical protein